MICATLAGCTHDSSPPDTDGDGVEDSIDLCPGTPANENVDADGCGQSQLDDDDDLVMNDIDLCPNTPAVATVDAAGCSSSQLDDDGDEVMNDVDLCPNTSPGATVDSDGCSAIQLDSDLDGVPDADDLCDDTDTGLPVDVNGCATNQLDSDGDGVTDDIDACPGTPAGEEVDVDGCSTSQIDTDGDGVMDSDDLCPNTPAGEPVDSDGCPLTTESEYTNITFFRAVDDDLFYFAYDTNDGAMELIKYNLISGKSVIKSFTSALYTGAYHCNSVSLGNTFYFVADDGINGYELWESDGTTSGTVILKDINSGSGGSYPSQCTPIDTDGDGEDDTIYFRAEDGTHGSELWKSDGTVAGTIMVKDINSGIEGSVPLYLTSIDNTLYFVARDGTHGSELWKSDGTAAGTTMVKDIRSGSTTDNVHIREITVVGNNLYFRADDGNYGSELWLSDGTELGTVMVKDINSGDWSSSSSPSNFIAFDADGDGEDDTIYFSANDGVHGIELWKSDGTELGTVMVKDINTGVQSGLTGYSSDLRIIGNKLYFRANDGSSGYELWESDGSPLGTMRVMDIWSGATGSYPHGFTVCSTLYFHANDGDGYELWKSDGTTAGTLMVEDIHTTGGTIFVYSSNMMCLGSTLFFVVGDNSNFEYLWKTDGTAVGTMMVQKHLVGNFPNIEF